MIQVSLVSDYRVVLKRGAPYVVETTAVCRVNDRSSKSSAAVTYHMKQEY